MDKAKDDGVYIQSALAVDSAASEVFHFQEETRFFEVAHLFHRRGGLAIVSEIQWVSARSLSALPTRAKPRWGARSRGYILRKGNNMAVKRHIRRASSKEQRQYEHIKKSAQRSGRYGKRAKEVAARTVMKQHRKKKKSSKR